MVTGLLYTIPSDRQANHTCLLFPCQIVLRSCHTITSETLICEIDSIVEHKPLLNPEVINDFIFRDNFNILCVNARSLFDKFNNFQLLLS